MSAMNLRPMSVLTFAENGGLYQITFRALFLFGRVCSCMYTSGSSKPLDTKAALYEGAAWLNTLSEDEISDNRCDIFLGSCFKTDGGWFDSLLIYIGSLLGFLNGR